jgi:Ca2+-binding EF-hand superfamily protein
LRKYHDQDIWQLSKEVVADLKEVFMLFDKDEDQRLSKCFELAFLNIARVQNCSDITTLN